MGTPMTAAEKNWIDGASYFQLLKKWRFMPTGENADRIFMGESGEYYKKVMDERRAALGPGGHTIISKEIGWTP